MRAKFSPSALVMITLSILTAVEVLPMIGVTHPVQASGAGPSALVSLFNEKLKTNAVINATLNGGSFVMDVNITYGAKIRGYLIGLNFTASVLHVASVYFGSSSSVLSNPLAFKYINFTNSQTAWTSKNYMVNDANHNNIYDTGDTVLYSPNATAPTLGLKMRSDSKFKFVDSNFSGLFEVGEGVFYDADTSNSFTTGDTLLSGLQPVLFDGVGTSAPNPIINNSAGFVQYNVVDTDTNGARAFVSGVGVLLRITFTAQVASGSTKISFNLGSQIQNPSLVPYQTIDGYFSNAASPVFNYSSAYNQTSVTVLRTVSGTNSSHVGTLTLTKIGSTVTATQIKVLGLPGGNTSPSLNVTSCTPTCHVSLQIQVQGGKTSDTTTTPSGTFPLAIVANETATPLVQVAWLTLIVLPPHPPVFSVTAPFTSFTQEAGNWTNIPVTATLTSGAPDTVTFGNTASSALGSATMSVTSGSFPVTTQVNFTTSPDSTLPGIAKKFNVTATTDGLYSEISVTKILTFTVTLIRTHDLHVTLETSSRAFAYTGVSLGGNPIHFNATIVNEGTVSETFSANITAKVVLAIDNKISYIDINLNGVWDLGEPIVYDNVTSLYSAGDTVIANGAPTLGTALKTDSLIKYVDSNANSVWNSGESVIYDADSGKSTASDFLIALGLTLKTDAPIKYVDTNVNNVWNSGESVIYDADSSATYTVGTSFKTDSLIRYVDANGNGVWNSGETVIYDADNTGKYSAGDTVIAGVAPTLGTALKTDSHIKYVDTNSNNVGTVGESVVYDTDGGGTYTVGDIVIANAVPTLGDTIIAGSTPAPSAALKTDANIKFMDSNGDNVWRRGEGVLYDANNNNQYNLGELVITGNTGTQLFTDNGQKFVDLNFNNKWDPSPLEAVVEDLNGNGIYDIGEPVGTPSTPSAGYLLAIQSGIVLAAGANKIV